MRDERNEILSLSFFSLSVSRPGKKRDDAVLQHTILSLLSAACVFENETSGNSQPTGQLEDRDAAFFSSFFCLCAQSSP